MKFNTEKRPTLKISINYQKRIFTLYFRYTDCTLKYRSEQLAPEPFLRMLQNTQEEWEAVLKENKLFHPID